VSIREISTLPKFDKQYKKLPKQIKELAKEKERFFREDPFHPKLRTHKLHGKEKEVWAFSVDYRYRIKFIFLNSASVIFINIGTHDEVY